MARPGAAARLKAAFAHPVVRLALWAAGLGVFTWLALRNADPSQAAAALRQAQPGWIGAALISVAANTLAKALRWRILLDDPQQPNPGVRLLVVLVNAQTVNLLIPGRFGEALRLALGGGPRQEAAVLASLAVEKSLDTAAYAALALALPWLLPLPAWLTQAAAGLFWAGAALLLGLALLRYAPQRLRRRLVELAGQIAGWLPARLAESVRQWAEQGRQALAGMLSRRKLPAALGLTALVWFTATATNLATGAALDLPLGWRVSAAALVVLQAGIAVPSTPGKLGVFQYLCVLALGWFGYDEAAGLSFGVLLYAVVFLPGLLFSLVYLLAGGAAELRQAASRRGG